MSQSSQLFELLKDPIRSRIMFEFMIGRRVTIKQLAQVMDKDRTTINYHLRKFIDAGVIKKVDEVSHNRGKPTLVYGLVESEYILKESTEENSVQTRFNALLDLAKNLNMLSAVAEQSHQSAEAKMPDTLEVEHHMLILSEDEVRELYQELQNTTQKFMKSKGSLKSKETQDNTSEVESDEISEENVVKVSVELSDTDISDSYKYIFYSGLFPIIRSTE